MFKIEAGLDGEKVVLRLSGRIQVSHLEQLKAQLANATGTVVLDLKEVTLVDLDVVRLLSAYESKEIELRHCAPYIREWIRLETARPDHDV